MEKFVTLESVSCGKPYDLPEPELKNKGVPFSPDCKRRILPDLYKLSPEAYNAKYCNVIQGLDELKVRIGPISKDIIGESFLTAGKKIHDDAFTSLRYSHILYQLGDE